MKPRLAVAFAVAVSVWAGSAHAAAPASSTPTAPKSRASLIAERMSKGDSYDRAALAVPQAPSDERDAAIQAEMNKGSTYRQARLDIAEKAEVVTARWNQHQFAMRQGASYEAGWAATAR